MSNESQRSVSVAYDEDVDVAYIKLMEGEVAVHKSIRLNDENIPGEVIIELDELNRIIGFEIIGAMSTLPPDFLIPSNLLRFRFPV